MVYCVDSVYFVRFWVCVGGEISAVLPFVLAALGVGIRVAAMGVTFQGRVQARPSVLGQLPW